jgi:hypothetical protein
MDPMGLLDKFKDKAADLAQGAKDRVSEATGFDADKIIDAAGSIKDGVESLNDAADSLKEGKRPS